MNKKSVYQLNGENGLVDTVIKLTKAGVDVCIHSTHSAGLGTYIVAWEGDLPEEPEEEIFIEEPEVEIPKPDFQYAVSLKDKYEKELDAKNALIAYAETFGISEDTFDKRKGFPKLVATFKGKWGSVMKEKNK